MANFSDSAYVAGNPYDPNDPDQAVLYQQWQNQHPGESLNTSDTKTPWWQIAATLGAGVAPFVAQGLAGGAAVADAPTGGVGEGPMGWQLAPTASAEDIAVGNAPIAFDPAYAATTPVASGATFGSTTFAPAAADTAPATAYAAGSPAAAMVPQGGTNPTGQDLRNTWDVPSGAPSDKHGFSWGDFFKNYGSDIIDAAGGTAGMLLRRSANKDAIAAQTAAANKAAQQEQQIAGATYANLNNVANQDYNLYRQSQQNLSPYTSLGGGAASLLGQGLGVPVSMPQPVQMGPPNFVSPVGGSLNAGTMSPRSTPGPNPFAGSQPFEGMSGMAQTGGGGFNPLTSTGGTTPTGALQPGQKVKMQAPDGSVEEVASQDVPHYQARGARIVGGA